MVKIVRSVVILLVVALFLPTTLLLPAKNVKAGVAYPIVYVDGTEGLDSYDGSSATVGSGNVGPKKTIGAGISAVSDNGTVNVAEGKYHEHNLQLQGGVNLVGAGARNTVIDGDASGHVLAVYGAPSQSHTISGFTIRNGASSLSDPGGGIYISNPFGQTVTINDCAIINNSKEIEIPPPGVELDYGVGAGIYNWGGYLKMNRCTVSGNAALFRGGGIDTFRMIGLNSGVVELTNCTISGNRVTSPGGIGGGISSGNFAAITMVNTTIANNQATGANSKGGGFGSGADFGSFYFKNCIVANNTAGDGIHNNGYDFWDDGVGIHSQGYNIDSENSCYFTDATDQRNTNPLLGTLQDNGGPTNTHAITASSPAFDRGTNDGAPATDQRGVVRPQVATCDIGAFELEPLPTVTSVNPNSGKQGQALDVTITGTNFVDITSVRFGALGSYVTVNSFAVNNYTQITASVTILSFASPGTRNVTVTNSYGKGTLANGFTVNRAGQQTLSVNTATGTGVATFTVDNGSINNLTALANTTCGPLAGFSFPHGFFSFTINNITPGSTVIVTITFPTNIPVGTQYWKCVNGQWVDVTSLLGDDDGDNLLTLTLTDDDADGTIVDPGGPRVPIAPAQVPTAMPASSESPQLPERLITAPAKLSVKYLNVQPQQAQANQPMTIFVNIANNGDEAGSYTATLKINGQVEETRTGRVGGHAAVPLKFEVIRDKPGTYNVDVNGQQASFVIVDDGKKEPAPTKDWALVGLIVCAVGVVVVSVLILKRRNVY